MIGILLQRVCSHAYNLYQKPTPLYYVNKE